MFKSTIFFLLKYMFGPFICLVIGRTILMVCHKFGWRPDDELAAFIVPNVIPAVSDLAGWTLVSIVGIWIYAVTCYFLFERPQKAKRKAANSGDVQRHGGSSNPRRLDTTQRQALMQRLSSLAGEHTNVRFVHFPARYWPFVEQLEGAFNAAGWAADTIQTHEEMGVNPDRGSGVEVKGFNPHLVEGVCEALRFVNVSDAYTKLIPPNVNTDNPKWAALHDRIYITVGHFGGLFDVGGRKRQKKPHRRLKRGRRAMQHTSRLAPVRLDPCGHGVHWMASEAPCCLIDSHQ